jgi:citrate lyase subunit beta/citryl-CoA lyase
MLFAPGNHSRRVEKALTLETDCVILDLEDAVAVAEKEETRPKVVEALRGPRRVAGYVRVNAFDTSYCYGDLCAVVDPAVDGIILPKLESVEQIRTVDWLVTQLERERGMSQGGMDILPIIETGRGLDAVSDIAACGSRVRRLSFGAGDYTLDMGMDWSLEEGELHYARARIAVASRAGGLEPPVDSVFIHLDQPEAMERSARLVKGLGYQGKLCIHPSQLEAVNRVFTPTEEEVARARRYVQAFDEAEAAGSASIQVDGYFIDYPIVEKARRVLAMAEQIASR